MQTTHLRSSRFPAIVVALISPVLWAQDGPLSKPTLVLADCESISTWAGGTLSTDIKQKGASSTRWAHGSSDNLTLRNPPADWSAYNHLALWVHSERATGTRFLLYIGSEDERSKGPDYYSRMFTLYFTGWKRYEFSLEDLGKARHPLGWDHITQVRFTASGWGNTPHPEAVVRIDDVVLTKEPPVTGPRLSDRAFFNALDLDRPDLAAVATAVKGGDYAAAGAAFVQHLKTRTTPKWHVERHPDGTEQRLVTID